MAIPDSSSITITEEIEIDAPPPVFWHIFRDLEAWPEWNPVCPEAHWLEGPSWRTGSTLQLSIRLGTETVSKDAVLVEDDYPWSLGWTSQTGDIAEHHQFDLDWYGQKTVVINTITLTSTTGSTDLAPLEPTIKEMSQAWLRALKEEVLRNGPNIWNLSSAESPRNAPLIK